MAAPVLQAAASKILNGRSKEGKPIQDRPLEIEVLVVKPKWLCGTFAFHPMLGFRRELQASKYRPRLLSNSAGAWTLFKVFRGWRKSGHLNSREEI